MPNNCGTYLLFQDSGGRGKWISEFKASLIYKVCSKTAKRKQVSKKNYSVYKE